MNSNEMDKPTTGEGEGNEGEDPAGQMQNRRRDKQENVEGNLLLCFSFFLSLSPLREEVDSHEEQNAGSLTNRESPALEHLGI